MARRNDDRLDSPKGLRTYFVPRMGAPSDRFGRFTEGVARAMGTPWFLFFLTVFGIVWLTYNVLAPVGWRFDSAALGFTALTLILSLQASYAAPLILLAQNRQDDRDRVQIEQDRQRAERNRAVPHVNDGDIFPLRLVVKDLASKDFIRAELRSLLEDLGRDRDSKSESVD